MCISTRVLGMFQLNFFARKIDLLFYLTKSTQMENLVVFLLLKKFCDFCVTHTFIATFLKVYSSSNSKPDESTLPIL